MANKFGFSTSHTVPTDADVSALQNVAIPGAVTGKVSVTTRAYDNTRNGANLNEKSLTALQVQKKGIKHLFDCELPGDARGSEGMPLIVPNLKMSDGMIHDVLYSCTMNNDVFAFDANTGVLLWKQHIGNPVNNNRKFDMYLINDHWGILSTPVIDPVSQTLYCVSLSSPTAQLGDAVFYLHALSLISGADKTDPLNLNDAQYQPPAGLPLIKMGALPRKQRSALVLDKRNGVDTVFVADSTFAMMSNNAHGFVVACDVSDINEHDAEMSIAATWTTTSRYAGAGMWMAAGGMSVDDDGYLYAMTGNGAFDGITDFGNAFVKLKYTPKTKKADAKIEIVDWWAAYSDSGRTGKDPTVPWIGLNANYSGVQDGASMTSPADQDLGCAAPILLPQDKTGFTKNVILGSGKDGILYVCDADNMGKTLVGDFAPTKIKKNYAKLLMPPYGFTYYPGGVDLAPTDLGKLSTTYYGFTHHQHATPVFYKSPDHGLIVYCSGENAPVRGFTISQNKDSSIKMTYLGQSEEVASFGVPSPGGMPGAMLSLSANGNTPDTAILWALFPIGDANKEITGGRLVAYGANWFAPGGKMVKIWDSQDWGIQYKHNKFNIPTVANGKLYVPSYDGRVLVFGLGDG